VNADFFISVSFHSTVRSLNVINKRAPVIMFEKSASVTSWHHLLQADLSGINNHFSGNICFSFPTFSLEPFCFLFRIIQ
jgi:hypothetical protein